MTLDRFGNDIYAPPETTETRQRDGIYTGLARPWERDAGMLDAKGHLCSRVCPKHGDLARWYDVVLTEYVPS